MDLMRSQLVPDLKLFIDMSKPQMTIEFDALVQQWSMSQTVMQPVYTAKQTYGSKPFMCGLGETSTTRKPINRFHCGKVGHMAKECRSRLAEAPKVTPTEQKESREVKPLVCCSCSEEGHKSHHCPNRKKEKVIKIKILSRMIECLAENDVMASVNSHLVPMILDSGAEVSTVPQEFVNPSKFTEEKLKFKSVFAKQEWTEAKVARVARIPIVIGSESFQEKVLAVHGEDLG